MKQKILILSLLCALGLSGKAIADDNVLQQSSATDNKATLSEFIQDNNDEKTDTEPADTKNTDTSEKKSWLGEIWEKGTQSVLSSSAPDVVPVKRSNASVFDIAGIMLRMNRQQVEEVMKKRGYRRISATMEIPNFIRWRYEELCRNKNVVGYERLNSCVVKLAQKNNYEFVEHLMFNKYDTKETISVNFTSNFTGNKAYLIDYKSEAANINGSGPKAAYLRNLKIYDFWKKINQKYGSPDNKEQVTWGLGFNKPSLHAETGHLTLHDPMLLKLDHSRMMNENQKFTNSTIYTF